MRHRVKGRKLNRTSSHRKATMRALVTALFEHKKIHTTEAKAKELRPLAEKIITKARKAYIKEQQGLIPEANKSNHDVHTRRLLGKDIIKKSVIEDLFDEIIPEISDRPGGYTRIVKTGYRRGDGGSQALIMLVDYFNEQDGTVALKGKKKKKSKPAPAPVVESVEESIETEETSEEVVDAADTVAEAEDQIENSEQSHEESTEATVEKTTESNDEVAETTDAEVQEVAEEEPLAEVSEEPVAEVIDQPTEEVEENSEEAQDSETSEEATDENTEDDSSEGENKKED